MNVGVGTTSRATSRSFPRRPRTRDSCSNPSAIGTDSMRSDASTDESLGMSSRATRARPAGISSRPVTNVPVAPTRGPPRGPRPFGLGGHGECAFQIDHRPVAAGRPVLHRMQGNVDQAGRAGERSHPAPPTVCRAVRRESAPDRVCLGGDAEERVVQVHLRPDRPPASTDGQRRIPCAGERADRGHPQKPRFRIAICAGSQSQWRISRSESPYSRGRSLAE